MASKRQTTMAKIARERARERRALLQEKRDQKRDARLAKDPETADAVVDAPSSEPEADSTPSR